MASQSLEEIFADGFAVKLYNIANDRETFAFMEERFDFKNEKLVAILPHIVRRSDPPLIHVCPVIELRRVANG